ncbi:hypothetical protein BD779DRAFT_1510723 [Infundibulicybe gibba]|nr:hypothetical protein BD779DRAFT_1510723 [Infundibulicybe gibba]
MLLNIFNQPRYIRHLFHRIPHTRLFNSSAPLHSKLVVGHGAKSHNQDLGRLLQSIQQYLTHPNSHNTDKTTEAYIHKKLDIHLSKRGASTPHIVYANVITLLVNSKRLEEATTVYERMLKGGFIPSTETDTQMLAVALALDANAQDAFPPELDSILVDPEYGEDRLLQLLRTLLNLNYNPRRVVKIVKRFLETRTSGYSLGSQLGTKLAEAQARAGLLEEALETIARCNDNANMPVPSTPYAAILVAIRNTNTWDAQAINRVLGIMKEHRVHPDISIFNILISREVRQRSLHAAFAFYNALKHIAPTTPIHPDAFTYGSLFSVLNKLYKPQTQRRSVRSRSYKLPDNVVPPRQLFADMVSAQTRIRPGHSDPAFVITPTILNVALRAFISKHDYAGAFVIIRSFSVFRLNVSAKTYFIVMKHIMNRIRYDIGRARTPGEYLNPSGGIRLVVDEKMVETILMHASMPTFKMSGDIISGDQNGPQKYITPTLKMIDGDDPVPRGIEFDSIPLERLLRRTIAASVEHTNHPVNGNAISKAIADAKVEMVPRGA